MDAVHALLSKRGMPPGSVPWFRPCAAEVQEDFETGSADRATMVAPQPPASRGAS